MSADSDSVPAPGSDTPASEGSPQTSDAYQFPQVKRRFKRESDAAGGPGDEEAPPPRRAARPGSEPAAASPEDQLRNEIDGLNQRLQALTEQRNAPRPTEAETRSAKYFRLTRKASAPASASAPAPAVSEPAGPVVLGPAALTRGPLSYHPPESAGWLLASTGVLALAALAFVLGWLSNRPTASTSAAAPVYATWSDTDITQLDRVLETERTGSLKTAFHEARSLDKQLGGKPGLGEYAAVLEARTGNLNNAEADLVRKGNSAAAPREIAATQERLGFVYTRRRNFNSAIDCFANAATADPFDPQAFYYWGETLRRAGRLPEAVAKFREALLRLPAGQPESDSLWQCAAFRMRLSQIELGGDGDLKVPLETQLRRPVPSVYWLLTAVAYDLQHNDVTDALAALERIKVVSSPELLDPLLNDYFLRALAARNKEVASYFPDLTAERRSRLDASVASFIDP